MDTYKKLSIRSQRAFSTTKNTQHPVFTKNYCSRIFPKVWESLADRLTDNVILYAISGWISPFMNQNHLKWHYWSDTICKNYINERLIGESSGNFRKVSKISMLRENGYCIIFTVIISFGSPHLCLGSLNILVHAFNVCFAATIFVQFTMDATRAWIAFCTWNGGSLVHHKSHRSLPYIYVSVPGTLSLWLKHAVWKSMSCALHVTLPFCTAERQFFKVSENLPALARGRGGHIGYIL